MALRIHIKFIIIIIIIAYQLKPLLSMETACQC